MRKKSAFRLKDKDGVRQRLLIVGTFFLVVAASLIIGLPNIDRAGSGSTAADQPSAALSVEPAAPTVDDYRLLALQTISPFLSEVAALSTNDPAGWDKRGELAVEADAVYERLLAMRVPAEAKDTHLRLVTFVDEWRRVLSASIADRRSVVADTDRLLKEQPWLMTGAASLGPDTTAP